MLSLSLNEIQQQQLFTNGIDQMPEIHGRGEVKEIIRKNRTREIDTGTCHTYLIIFKTNNRSWFGTLINIELTSMNVFMNMHEITSSSTVYSTNTFTPWISSE